METGIRKVPTRDFTVLCIDLQQDVNHSNRTYRDQHLNPVQDAVSVDSIAITHPERDVK